MQADGHLLAHVIEYTPIGILILERDTNIVFVNQYVLNLFTVGKEDIIGKTLNELAGKLRKKFNTAPIIKAITEGKVTDYKLALSLQGRPDIVCLLNSFCIDEIEPYPECIALVIRDITREQAAADLIEAKNVEMAKMNSELARSNAELKKVSELKSNFLSIASHELNTPLTSIKGYSDIIIDNMRDKAEPNVFRMIESISRAADRLHKVVNNILDVTKIEQGRLRLRPENIDLAAIMRDCAEELGQLADKRGITIRTNVCGAEHRFYGDKIRMLQMFTNLLNNAIKYSPDGSPVEAAIEVKPGKYYHITITDRGIGIDKSEHKTIFDPFYEVGSATRHSTDSTKFMGSGSGLGLSIVKGIVERHGGRVWVESEGTKKDTFPGSAFHIILPLRSEISWDDDESKISESRIRETDGICIEDMEEEEDRDRPVILFIDPDRESTEIASTTIENVFDILVAESGEQGLIIAFNHKPSLILMDSQLPGLDGHRICRILRSQEETKNIPIAFFSAGAQEDEIQKCFASGANDFIVKPFSGSELVNKVCRLLMKKKEDEVFK
ncbi:MAG: response regulator [Chitinispirillales bacterium]|jgi:PAS domain S-box-containing protein|nr:response regulator [Chitinispirillales bacterium]